MNLCLTKKGQLRSSSTAPPRPSILAHQEAGGLVSAPKLARIRFLVGTGTKFPGQATRSFHRELDDIAALITVSYLLGTRVMSSAVRVNSKAGANSPPTLD
jgi:hypothetical protein